MSQSLGDVQNVPLTFVSISAGRRKPVFVHAMPRKAPYEERQQMASKVVAPGHRHSQVDRYADIALLASALAHLCARINKATWQEQMADLHIVAPHAQTASDTLHKCVAEATQHAAPCIINDAFHSNADPAACPGRVPFFLLPLSTSTTLHGTQVVYTLCMNEHKTPQRIHWIWRGHQSTFTLPPRSGFLLMDLLREEIQLPRAWLTLIERLDTMGGADLVLLDPPWPNQSAQRAWRGQSRFKYRTMLDLYDMWRLRPAMESLIRPHTLVAVWVTNHVRISLLPFPATLWMR